MSSNFRVRIWCVVGEQGSGKTTTIGYLVSQHGKGGGGFRDVLLRGGGYIRVYALRQSRQEAGKTPAEVIKDVDNRARRLQGSNPGISIAWMNVLISLRVHGLGKCPTAQEYLNAFVKAGWFIESLVLMQYTKPLERFYDYGAPVCELYESKDLVRDPRFHQWMVGQVRNHFGWA